MSVENESTPAEFRGDNPIQVRNEMLREYFEYLPDKYGEEDFRQILYIVESELEKLNSDGKKGNDVEVRLLGSIAARLRKIIQDYQNSGEKYTAVKSAEEKYGSIDKLRDFFDLS